MAHPRDRKPDVFLLAAHCLEKSSSEHGRNVRRISTPAIDTLMAYHWPGNVRELANVIERAVVVCDGSAAQLTLMNGFVAREEL